MVLARNLVTRLGIVAGCLVVASVALAAPQKKKPLLRVAPQDFAAVEAVCGVKWQTRKVKGRMLYTGKLLHLRDPRPSDPDECITIAGYDVFHRLTRGTNSRSWLDIHDPAVATMLGKWAPICERASKATQHNKRCRNPSKFRKKK